jgi:hypothetical protein
MPGVDEASVVGDERVCVIGGGGGRLVERVLSHDDTTRRYEYSIVEAPMPLDQHRAAMWVEPDGDGSRFFWEITVEPMQPQSRCEALRPHGVTSCHHNAVGARPETRVTT